MFFFENSYGGENKTLEVETDPEFKVEFSVRIDTEWSGNVYDFQAFRPIEMQGETEEEALEHAKEAILCYLEGIEKLNEIKGMPGVTLREVEVTI